MYKVYNKKLISFLVLVGIISFGFSLQDVNAQALPTGCCQGQGACIGDIEEPQCPGAPDTWTEGASCIDNVCVGPVAIRNVPTLSEWGLIVMASILGIVGFMVIRRRKAIA